MLKNGTFINKQFNKLMLGMFWGALAYSINLMTDSLVSGNQLGEVALEAVSVVYPMFSLLYFFSYLIPMGASILYGKAIGEFKKEEASRIAGTCITSSIVIGLLLSLILWLVKVPFLTYFGCTGELFEEASKYYNWLIIYAPFQTISSGIYYIAAADGESILFSIACIVEIVLNIVLSFALSNVFGISGLGMATCIGIFVEVLLYSTHLLKKTSNVKLRLCLDFKIIGRSIVLSFSDYMYYLFLAIVDIIMNKIIVESCGMEYIPAYSVVNLVFSICEMFICFNSASIGLVTCFYGERNNHSLDLIFRKLTRSIIIMSAGISAFFFFGAPLMPLIYGLESEATINAAILASKIMAFATLGFGACYISEAISSYVEKPFQACFISFLGDVFAPLLLSLIFGYFWGFTGIAIGMALSTYLALGIYALIYIPRKGKKGFPIYVKDFGEEGYSYDICVTNESIVEIRDAVSRELSNHGYDSKNIDLLLEEFFTRVMEKNSGKKVIAECTLLFGENSVRVIIRDNGVIFNFVDENNEIESLNAHVLNSLLENTNRKNYMITASFNRNGFVFEKCE